MGSIFQAGRVAAFAMAFAAAAIVSRPAEAHPHVMVTAATIVNVEQGAIQSITHVWTFDEFYTAQALDGLPKNKDGLYGREELAELAKVNVEGLKEFNYFTFASIDKTELKVGDPKPGDFWLEHKDGVLSLHFTIPLEKPLPMKTKGFGFIVTDPSYFIAFELAPKDAAKLNAGAPASCKIAIAEQKETEEEKKLNGAFSQQMSAATMFGVGPPKRIEVDCND